LVREVDLIGQLPEFVKGYKEIQIIMSVENPEIQIMENESEVFLNNQFIDSTNEIGVKRFETLLGIQPLDTDTLQDRQFKVMSRWNRSIPYTRNTLKNRLTTLCGEDGFSIQYETGKIIVRIALTSKRTLSDVALLLEDVIPCDMLIDLSLLYNQHKTLSRFTHKQLSGYTHKQIRNEVLK
jgi:hypothetical protein